MKIKSSLLNSGYFLFLYFYFVVEIFANLNYIIHFSEASVVLYECTARMSSLQWLSFPNTTQLGQNTIEMEETSDTPLVYPWGPAEVQVQVKYYARWHKNQSQHT